MSYNKRVVRTDSEVDMVSHGNWTSPSSAWRPAIAWYFVMALLHFGYFVRQPIRSTGDVLAAVLLSALLGIFGFVGYFMALEILKWNKDRNALSIHFIVPFAAAALELFCLFLVPLLFGFLVKLVEGPAS